MRDRGWYQFQGRVFPSRFAPHYDETPEDLFPYNSHFGRFVNVDDRQNLLIYTDGACVNNGYSNAAAGWGFVFKPGSDGAMGRYYRFLPSSERGQETSNRAELRAVLDALRHMDWRADGYRYLTIATDSQYVTNGATSWVRSWVRNGWVTSDGQEVKNRDLWSELLAEIECLHDEGLAVNIWWIPRQYNTEADRAAKGAANEAARYR